MFTIKYDNITTLMEVIANAPAGHIAVVMPEGAGRIHASFIALSVEEKGIAGLKVQEDLTIIDGLHAFVVKKA